MALAIALKRPKPQRSGSGAAATLAGIFFGAGACLLAGVAVAFLPWWLVLGLVAVPVVIVGGVIWPFPILLLALALVCQAVPGRFVPPVGSFRIHELIILYLVAVVSMRALWQRESLVKPLGPFLWPLVYLYACVLMSAIYVKFFAPNPTLLSELRRYVTWLILPLLAYVVRTEQQRKVLMYFAAAVALTVSAYVLLESMLHISLLENGTGALDTVNTDVTRSTAGGTTYLMVFTLLWVINAVTAGTRWFVPALLAALVCAGGIAIGFGRGVWIATAIGFVIATWLNRGFLGMLVSVILAGVTLAVLMLAFAAVKPRVVEAIVERAVGVTQELRSGGSFQWRQIENEYALAALKKRPLTGVGIGGEYKPRVSAEASFATETQYIHNAYMGLMVKMGFHAIVFPLWMITLFAVHAARLKKTVAKLDRPFFGAVVATFFVPVITSFTQPEWIVGPSVAVFCMLIAMFWLLERRVLAESPLVADTARGARLNPPIARQFGRA